MFYIVVYFVLMMMSGIMICDISHLGIFPNNKPIYVVLISLYNNYPCMYVNQIKSLFSNPMINRRGLISHEGMAQYIRDGQDKPKV